MKKEDFLVTAAMYFSVALAVFVTVMTMTGMVAFFLKTFFHIPPTWMFGLFD